MIIGPDDQRAGLAAIAEQVVTAYLLLLERDDPTISPAIDVLFDALGSLDVLAGGITSPSVRQTLDLPSV